MISFYMDIIKAIYKLVTYVLDRKWERVKQHFHSALIVQLYSTEEEAWSIWFLKSIYDDSPILFLFSITGNSREWDNMAQKRSTGPMHHRPAWLNPEKRDTNFLAQLTHKIWRYIAFFCQFIPPDIISFNITKPLHNWAPISYLMCMISF